MLLLNIDAYEEKYVEKAIRKTPAIPTCLKTFFKK